MTVALKKFLMEGNKRHRELERKLILPGIQKKTLQRAMQILQEAWDKYDEAYSDETFDDPTAAETEHGNLDNKVGDLLSRVEEFLEPEEQRQESDAGNGGPKIKYDVKAAAQQTSFESNIAIMERELDRDDATPQDILKYEQRMSAMEALLDTNLTEVYTSWMETVDEAAGINIMTDLKGMLNDFNDQMRRMRDAV